jgi:sulfur carrier protein
MVNGQPRELADGRTVRDLVEELGLGKAAVAVEVNREVVPRRQHEQTALHEGDNVEVVTLVGGG